MLTKTTSTRFFLGLMALWLMPGSSWAGEFIDSRISFTIGDDNFLKRGGEQIPDSPHLSISDREGYELPFDNLDLATSGRENELHLVLYKKAEGVLPGLTTEVAAALEVDMAALETYGAEIGRVLSDDSSYIRLKYAIDPAKRGDKYLDLVLFPLSGDRFRAGYLYDLTWGGSDMFPKRQGLTPGFKLGGNHGRWYWWGGMKTVIAPTEPSEYTDETKSTSEIKTWETLYGVLAGAGVQPLDGLSVDLSGGHLQVARNPIKDVAGELITTSGASLRLAYGRGLNVGLSSDLQLLRNDPEFLETLGRRPQYNPGGGLSWRVGLEGSAIVQVLADPDRFGATKRQWASAAALDARLQYNYLRLNLTGVYRGLEFNLRNNPSLTPYSAIRDQAVVKPQIFGAIAADYYFPRISLNPGIQFGVDLPSAVTTEMYATEAGNNPPPTLVGETTIIVRTTGEWIPLPKDEDRVPVYSARLTTRWFASDILTMLAFVIVSYDENAVLLIKSTDAKFVRIFDDPFRFGAGITAQARF